MVDHIKDEGHHQAGSRDAHLLLTHPRWSGGEVVVQSGVEGERQGELGADFNSACVAEL